MKSSKRNLGLYLIVGTFVAFGLFLIFGGVACGNEQMIASGASVCGVAGGMIAVACQ